MTNTSSNKETHSPRPPFLRPYTTLIIWALLLTPMLPTPDGLPSIRIDDLLLIAIPLILFVFTPRLMIDIRIIIIFLIAISMELGMLVGTILGYPVSILDHFSLFRLAKYIGAVMLATALMRSQSFDNDHLKWFIRKTTIPGLLLIAIVMQQYFNIGDLNKLYVNSVAPGQSHTLVENYPNPRPVGMIGNPNELGFLLGVLCLTSAWMSQQRQEKTVSWGLISLTFLLAASSTLSRSAVFATLFGLLALLGSSFFESLKNENTEINAKIWPFLIGFSALGLALILALSNESLFNSIFWRFMPSNYDSFYKRIDHWNENIQLWKQSPIFGIGFLKHSDFLKQAADNEWLKLARVGGLTLVILVGYLFCIGLFSKKTVKKNQILSRSLVAASFLYMIPAALFFNLVLMPLTLMLLTISSPRPAKNYHPELKNTQHLKYIKYGSA